MWRCLISRQDGGYRLNAWGTVHVPAASLAVLMMGGPIFHIGPWNSLELGTTSIWVGEHGYATMPVAV